MRVNVALDHAAAARFSPDSRAFLVALANENRLRVYRIARPITDGPAAGPPPITPVGDLDKVSRLAPLSFPSLSYSCSTCSALYSYS